MSELANHILQAINACYQIGWSVAEGRIMHDVKQHDPSIVQLYRFPHEFDAAMKELAQAKYIEKHPIFPDWKMLKFPEKAEGEKAMNEQLLRTWKVYTSLYESEAKETLTRPKLYRNPSFSYPDFDPNTDITQNGNSLIITIRMMSWDEVDATVFNDLYNREIINTWRVVEDKNS